MSKYTERIYDEFGKLLIEQGYPFARLFKVGQEQVIDGKTMTVIECGLHGYVITTKVQLHSPHTSRQQPVKAEGDYFEEIVNEINKPGWSEKIRRDNQIVVLKSIHNHAIDEAVGIIKHSDTKFEAMDAIEALKK